MDRQLFIGSCKLWLNSWYSPPLKAPGYTPTRSGQSLGSYFGVDYKEPHEPDYEYEWGMPELPELPKGNTGMNYQVAFWTDHTLIN